MAGEKATQDDRILKLTTPLGKDFLLIESFTGRESISSLFSFTVDLLHQEDSETAPPHVVEPTEILGKTVMIELVQRGGTTRHFHGIVNRFTQGGRHAEFTSYQLEVVPQLWMLTQSRQSRIFQSKSVADILVEVLEGLNFKMELRREYQPRNFCVQYRESDFDFASRMMEEEGIFYYFEHTENAHTMIIADDPRGHPGSHHDCPSKSSIDFLIENTGELLEPLVSEWLLEYRLQTGKIELRDYHFQLPDKNLEAPKPSIFSNPVNQEVEIYDHPGRYAKRFDGISQGGSDQSDKLQKVFQDSKQVAQSAVDALDAKHKTFHGTSDCSSFTAGHKFKIDKLPIKDQNGQYALISVSHFCKQTPEYRSTDEHNAPYLNRFACIPVGDTKFAPFRPPHITPKPTVHGSMTAVVVGPQGEEIHTDKFGRVKVQFHWDREGKNNEASSCWLRVCTSVAGNKWGTMFIPRVGQEVLVEFEHGDPDQPIIVGAVYNPLTMPHYELPKFKTLSYIKTRTSPDDGKGFNELRFEDKANKEQVFVHSQKRMDVRVKQDYYETNGGTRQESIGGSNARTAGGTLDLKIKDATYIGIKGKLNEAAEGEVVEDYKSSHFTLVGTKSSLNAQEIIIEAKTKISLKVGASCIVIEPALITIAAQMVKINSGGFGTETGDPAIDDPLDAGGADTGEPGFLDRPRTGGGRGRNHRQLHSQHHVYPPRPGESAAFTAMRNRLNTSAQGRHALEVFERNGVQVTNNPGGTAYSGNPTNSVNLDPARAGDAAPGFVHEMGHAEADHGGTSADVQAQTRADYIDTQLREDAHAERSAYESEEQMNAAGGSERYNSSTRTTYQNALNAERTRLRAAEPGISDEELNRRSHDAAEAAILQDYRNGNVNTGNTTPPQSYVNYWGSDYDARHRP
jgi:type VI secretion system secreted protein VgrG